MSRCRIYTEADKDLPEDVRKVLEIFKDTGYQKFLRAREELRHKTDEPQQTCLELNVEKIKRPTVEGGWR